MKENEEDRNVSCFVSDCWVLSLSKKVKKTRIGLIYEGIHGLSFSRQFVYNFKAMLDPS